MDDNEATQPGDEATSLDPGLDDDWGAGPAPIAASSVLGRLADVTDRDRLDRFAILDKIGTGAMGTVFAAYDPQLDRKIAVKVIHPADGGAMSAKDRRRVITEARAMAKVTHPNVVSVFGVGEHTRRSDGPRSVFVAMEFVHGKTLRRWVEEDAPSWSEIVAAYVAAGQGLAAAHRAGLVHRDFKPDNAMIDRDGHVRVMDFGLARSEDYLAETAEERRSLPPGNPVLTRTGTFAGSPAYMAPEAFHGEPATARTDQYSWCVSLYEALWGRRPFEAGSLAELVRKVVEAERAPEPPRSEVPARVRQAVLRGTSTDPDARWPSMDTLLASLRPRVGTAKRAFAGVLVLGVLGGMAAYSGLSGAPDLDPCADVRAEISETLGPEKAAAIERQFAEVAGAAGATIAADLVPRLQSYATRWTHERVAACEARYVHHDESDAMHDKRLHCLQRRKRKLGALVERLTEADPTVVRNAQQGALLLVPPKRCSDPAFLDAIAEPPSPEMLARVQRLQAELDTATATYITGAPREALELTRSVAARANELDYLPLRAEVTIALGRIEFSLGNATGGLEYLSRAYDLAREGRDSRIAFRAALDLATAEATMHNDYRLADHWLRQARLEAKGAGLDGTEADLLQAQAVVDSRRGRIPEATAAAEAHVELLRDSCEDPPCLQMDEALSKLSDVYGDAGRREASIRAAREAVEIAMQLHGEQHPHAVSTFRRLGSSLINGRDFDEGVEWMQRAIAMGERTLEPNAIDVALMQAELGPTLVELGRTDEGIDMLVAARDKIFELGFSKQLEAAVLNQLGVGYDNARRFEEAERAYASAVTAMEALHPDGHPDLAVARANLGRMRLRVGDPQGALDALEAALQMRRATTKLDHDPTEALFLREIGRALLELGRDEEAVERLMEAVEALGADTTDGNGTRVRFELAKALAKRDRKRSNAMLSELLAQCDAASEADRIGLKCDAMQRWREEH